MKDPDLRRRLRAEPIPGEHEAREHAWRVVSAAFAGRERIAWPRRHARGLALGIAVLGILAGALSSPGRAVLDSVRRAVGVERAQPALFSLPAPGRLLVSSRSGIWIVQQDGSKRLLRGYREASWSPFGRFLVAARRNELVALDAKGGVRWSLARPHVRFPRWAGSRSDTRIAYLSGSRLHLVAGDGTGDVDLCGDPAAAPVAPAWRPGTRRLLAYATTRGRIYVLDADRCSLEWRSPTHEVPTQLRWSSDGERLLALGPDGLRVYDRRGREVARDNPSEGTREADAVFLPGTHELAVIRIHGAQSDVFLLGGGRLLFRGPGIFQDLTWSPDGRRLLVGWRSADQWLFIPFPRPGRVVAVSNIGRTFGGFPHVAGWCC